MARMTPLRELEGGYGELRSMVLDFLANWPPTQPLELNTLNEGVGEVALRRGATPVRSFEVYSRPDPALSDKDFRSSCEIIWDLIIEGVVRPASLSGEQNMPRFHVTDRGRELLKHGSLSPYDPDGYFKRLDSNVPGLDRVVRMYLVESAHTLRIGCLLASTITLGCASEAAILNLIDAYANALPENAGEAFKKKLKRDDGIKKRFDEFIKSTGEHIKPPVPKEFVKEFNETMGAPIKSLFEMYRVQRNQAGHPTGEQLSPEEVHSHLVAFPHYIKRLYSLIDSLKNKAILSDQETGRDLE